MASVLNVCVSTEKGTVKLPVESVILRENHGIEGDAHAGAWHRQVSLLPDESIDELRKQCEEPFEPGVFAENIRTKGIRLRELPIGTQLQVGPCVLEISQIGKTCHSDCEIKQKVGQCVMPKEGVFARVLTGGTVRPGDEIIVLTQAQ